MPSTRYGDWFENRRGRYDFGQHITGGRASDTYWCSHAHTSGGVASKYFTGTSSHKYVEHRQKPYRVTQRALSTELDIYL